MDNVFTLEKNGDFAEKIDIDELFEKKQKHDLQQLELFNKVLNRIHVHIKTHSRQTGADSCCWYVVPEIMLGVPRFDHGQCVAYLVSKLQDNGFQVKYFHPNCLFISWYHWVPSYVRQELKKKTGIEVDSWGRKIEEVDDFTSHAFSSSSSSSSSSLVSPLSFSQPSHTHQQAPPNHQQSPPTHQQSPHTQSQQKKYTPIQNYKPSGNWVYDPSLLHKTGNRFS